MSLSLAARMRPRRFADVAGQAAVVEVLSALVQADPLPQQLLLAGPSGVGKTTLARIWASALYCSDRDGHDACGACESCRLVAAGRHPDLMELDAASHGGVDQVRALAEQAHLAPALADRRIWVIDEAHGLTRDGGQAFLKLLEEPPAHTVFVLATTDPQKLPDALRGRCLSLYVAAPTRGELLANLDRVCADQGWAPPADVLEVVVDGSDPALGVRGTLTSLEKVAPLLASSSLDVSLAARMLGVADPADFAHLTHALVRGDRAGALGALPRLRSATSDAVLLPQLRAWASSHLASALTGEGDVEVAGWLLTALWETGPLEVLVARACSANLAGVAGLETLTRRAEEAADRLAGLLAGSPAPQTAPPTPQPRTVAATPSPGPVPESAPPAASPAPAETPSSTTPSAPVEFPTVDEVVPAQDPQMVALLNAVSKVGGARAALALRRAHVTRTGAGLRVVTDDAALVDALPAAAAAAGVELAGA